MAAITVRNLPEETHRALKARAVSHSRSTEAEVRAILEEAVADGGEVGLGTRIHRIASMVGGFETDHIRSKAVTEPPDFG